MTEPNGQEAGGSSASPTRMQAREKTYQELKKGILGGTYRPSQHLVEQAIADQLKVSKTPVREALARLEQEGLVESFPNRGFFVCDFTEQDVRQIYELRELYEGACARAAAQRPGHEDFAERLKSINHLARMAFLAGRIHEVHQNFSDFDEIIFAQSDNQLLQQEIDRIRARIYLSGVLTNQIPGRIEKSLSQHDEILDAIRRGDARAAEELTRIHIRSLMDDELEHRRMDVGAPWGLLG